MTLTNIQPFEPCRFRPGTQGFYGLCSFCGKVYAGRERGAEFMAKDIAGRLFALCKYHGKQAIFDEKTKAATRAQTSH